MTTLSIQRYTVLVEKAKEYHNHAQWEEKLRALHEALQICDDPDFPDASTSGRRILFEIAGIQKRLGRYDSGIKTLEKRLQVDADADLITRAKIYGEMGNMYRLSNQYKRARDLFLRQYALANEGEGLEAEAQMCQAIGNAAMANYNLATQQYTPDPQLLDDIVSQLHDRIRRARDLHAHLRAQDPKSSYLGISQQWETVGMNRLILCYILRNESGKAVAQAKETLQRQNTEDPNVRAFTSFFCGYAFWADGQHTAALRYWTVPSGATSPVMALCKEASREHVEYLRLLADVGLDFNSHDENGSTALDFAVLSDSADAKTMVEIILDVTRKLLKRLYQSTKPELSETERANEIQAEVLRRHRQSLLRREYRGILQEHIRPVITGKRDCIKSLRTTYAALLASDLDKRVVLGAFYYVKYTDFKALGRMPSNEDRLARRFEDGNKPVRSKGGQYIVFLSYRHFDSAHDPSRSNVDDHSHTQYNRMTNAIDAFLAEHEGIDAEQMCLWLDCACIDQNDLEERERGIDALPFAVIQCDAMISLVDDAYWTRAWCAVEVTLMQELQKAYKIHSWFEHRLHDHRADRVSGYLREGATSVELDIGNLQLTNEALDRPKIEFLLRQSKLLGKDIIGEIL